MFESSDRMFSRVSLVKTTFLYSLLHLACTIKQRKRVCLITLGNCRFLQRYCGRRVNFPGETVNVIEVSAAGIFGLQRLCEQQVVPQPVMEVSFSLMQKGETDCLIALSLKRPSLCCFRILQEIEIYCHRKKTPHF